METRMRRVRRPIPPSIRFFVLRRDDFTCQYCGGRPPKIVLHVDHLKAVANGGSNHPNNLIAACDDCNIGKGTGEAKTTERRQPTIREDVLERELWSLHGELVGAFSLTIGDPSLKLATAFLASRADICGEVVVGVQSAAGYCEISEADLRSVVHGLQAVGLIQRMDDRPVIDFEDGVEMIFALLRFTGIAGVPVRPPLPLAHYWEPAFFSSVERVHG